MVGSVEALVKVSGRDHDSSNCRYTQTFGITGGRPPSGRRLLADRKARDI